MSIIITNWTSIHRYNMAFIPSLYFNQRHEHETKRHRRSHHHQRSLAHHGDIDEKVVSLANFVQDPDERRGNFLFGFVFDNMLNVQNEGLLEAFVADTFRDFDLNGFLAHSADSASFAVIVNERGILLATAPADNVHQIALFELSQIDPS